MDKELLIINPQVLEDKELIKQYLELKNKLNELQINLKVFESEIRLRTNENKTTIGNYEVDFKSSKLFDKSKAKEYIEKNNLSDKFLIKDYDYKKVQSYIKAVENYEDFIKLSKPKIEIKNIRTIKIKNGVE